MLKKNALSVGLIVGVLLPILGFPLLYGLFTGLESMEFMNNESFRPQFKERTSAIVAIALNAIALNYYQKYRMTESMRGIVIPTFLYVVLWLVMFGATIL